MSRKTEILSNRDFYILVQELPGDVAESLRQEFESYQGWPGKDVEVTVDSMGRLDSMSSPRPAN